MGLVAQSQPGSGTLWHGVILRFASFLEGTESQSRKGRSWSQGDLARVEGEARESVPVVLSRPVRVSGNDNIPKKEFE